MTRHPVPFAHDRDAWRVPVWRAGAALAEAQRGEEALVDLTAAALRAAFDAPEPLTLGLEEEVMLLHPETLDLLPQAAVVVAAAADPRIKLEMPASQLELALPPVRSVSEAFDELAAARRALAAAAEPYGRLAAAGVHPFAAPLGELNAGARYDLTADEYGDIARSQLVCALQVHIAVGGADRSLAVYNGLRAWLPLIAAVAANAPFHAGRDTGLASIRPKINDRLPRQGIPPAIGSWEALAAALAWGAAAGAVPEPRRWWWELRPHPTYGTLEIRVPDSQSTVREAGAVAALVYALVVRLARRYDAGEVPRSVDTWRLEENRWRAARWGMQAELADLETAEPVPARDCLAVLLDELAPIGEEFGIGSALREVAAMALCNGAARQRELAANGGLRAVVGWLADAYVPSADCAPYGKGSQMPC